jgi:hypothetical protein
MDGVGAVTAESARMSAATRLGARRGASLRPSSTVSWWVPELVGPQAGVSVIRDLAEYSNVAVMCSAVLGVARIAGHFWLDGHLSEAAGRIEPGNRQSDPRSQDLEGAT